MTAEMVNALDLTPRRTVWWDAEVRAAVADLVTAILTHDQPEQLTGEPLSVEDMFLLQQVRTELNVVQARGAFTPRADARERATRQLPDTAEPVRLSDGEARALSRIPRIVALVPTLPAVPDRTDEPTHQPETVTR